MRNGTVLHRIKEEKDILQITKEGRLTRLFNVFRRNCILKHVIVGEIEGTG